MGAPLWAWRIRVFYGRCPKFARSRQPEIMDKRLCPRYAGRVPATIRFGSSLFQHTQESPMKTPSSLLAVLNIVLAGTLLLGTAPWPRMRRRPTRSMSFGFTTQTQASWRPCTRGSATTPASCSRSTGWNSSASGHRPQGRSPRTPCTTFSPSPRRGAEESLAGPPRRPRVEEG